MAARIREAQSLMLQVDEQACMPRFGIPQTDKNAHAGMDLWQVFDYILCLNK